MRETGSHGGQNGLRNIIEHLGTTSFKRMRIGIGKSELTDKADYVLGKLSKAELDVLMPTFDKACFAIKEWIETNDFNKVMTKYNTPRLSSLGFFAWLKGEKMIKNYQKYTQNQTL